MEAGHPPGTTVGYDGTVTDESVIRELFARMPDLDLTGWVILKVLLVLH
jgi:hypothetical protein